MAGVGADINAAYNEPDNGIIKKWDIENPQLYETMQNSYVHENPQRHQFGLIGGNEVAVGNSVNSIDIESDLRGINRPNTFAPWRQYQVPVCNQQSIVRNNTKGAFETSVQEKPLKEYQMWSYPVMPTPVPFVKEVYGGPEKY